MPKPANFNLKSASSQKMNCCNTDLRKTITRNLARRLTQCTVPGAGLWLRNFYKLLGPLAAGPCITDTDLGIRMIVDPRRNKGIDASLYYNGVYEAGTLHFLQQVLRPGDTFVDVGANIGLMSIIGAKLVGPHGWVHAFEPVPAIHSVLEQNVRLNGLANVTAHRIALGAAKELREIREQPQINRGSASLLSNDDPTSIVHLVEVDTADNLFEAADTYRVRLVKIDVEGWELEVLRGAEKLLSGSNAPIICLEYSPSHAVGITKARAAYQFIKSVNEYQVFRLRRGKEVVSPLRRINSSSGLPSHDNIFCLLPEHLRELETSAAISGGTPP